MKSFTKHVSVCLSALILLSSGFLYGCSSSSNTYNSTAASGDSAKAPGAPEVNKDAAGYTIWTLGENNFGDGITVDLSHLEEERFDGFYDTSIRAGMELLSTTNGILDNCEEEPNEVEKYSVGVTPLMWLYKESPARSLSNAAKDALAEKFPNHFKTYKGTEENYQGEVFIGQVPLSSSDSLDYRVQQMNDWLDMLNRDTYKYPDKAEKATDNIYKIPSIQDSREYRYCWRCILKDGMLTVINFNGPSDSLLLNNLVMW